MQFLQESNVDAFCEKVSDWPTTSNLISFVGTLGISIYVFSKATATSVIKKRLVGISFGFAIWYGIFGRNTAGAIDKLPQLNREDVNIIPREIELRPRIFPASATEKKDHFSYRNN
ncbi:hypothetical protein [Candidatus Uabimicrobium sp. HlEnr_7]|uniref:hypothetical protein n=1 Tax=Candidatus Uabimicrobium helgolandensis TaxID=3095367 RepID=UPI0035565A3E